MVAYHFFCRLWFAGFWAAVGTASALIEFGSRTVN